MDEAGVGFGVPLEEVGPEARFLRGEPMARRLEPSAVCVTTGERAMMRGKEREGERRRGSRLPSGSSCNREPRGRGVASVLESRIAVLSIAELGAYLQLIQRCLIERRKRTESCRATGLVESGVGALVVEFGVGGGGVKWARAGYLISAAAHVRMDVCASTTCSMDVHGRVQLATMLSYWKRSRPKVNQNRIL